MSQDVITLFLPVIWAVIATIIGLALYKTSDAFFESSQNSGGASKKIRLVGSVTIAAVAFYGMKLATPSNRLQGIPDGAVVISSADVRALYDASSKLDRSGLELEGCVHTEDLEDCSRKVEDVRNQISSLNSSLARVIQESEHTTKQILSK
jgi:ABC-type phosphate transport system auxiliary subunit